MRISVVVHPNSKKARIEKDLLGQLHVYVNQPPLEGRANKAVIEALAKHFNMIGPPVVIFFDTNGHQIQPAIVGEVQAKDLIQRLHQVLQGQKNSTRLSIL